MREKGERSVLTGNKVLIQNEKASLRSRFGRGGGESLKRYKRKTTLEEGIFFLLEGDGSRPLEGEATHLEM